jgi:AGZA family xanthine/uracil permease-like MFS transporter
MTTYRWASRGDINAFFGLILDNIAVLVLLVGTISRADAGPDQPEAFFTPQFVVERMVPGTALGVLVGDLVYTWMAFRLAQRSGKPDVTAMPLGLDTPSTFAVGFLVLLPALRRWLGEHPRDHDTAMVFAWHVGAVILVLIGLFKTLVAPLGNAVRRWVPRAGLLGSLAAIALALIAFLPLLFEIAAVPLVGMLTLTVILITLVARRPLPGNIPGALAAVILGVAVFFLCRRLDLSLGVPLVPPPEQMPIAATATALPPSVWTFAWWEQVLVYALGQLPVMLPFALATIVGGIDCTESAAAVGDEYDTRTILLTEGLASVAAGLAGGVIQNTPYIGQPAYKAMGGRAAYTLATALFIGAAGFFGWFAHMFEWLPKPAMFPILVFVGLEITAQSFHATPVKHYPAVALAALPALAYLGKVLVDMSLAGRDPAPHALGMQQTLWCLANGFIVTSLLWGAALAALLDERPRQSAAYLLVAALLSLVGVMHSPFLDAVIAWPWDVVSRLPPAALYQTPYHWAAAYALMAALLLLLGQKPPEPTPAIEEEKTPPPP